MVIHEFGIAANTHTVLGDANVGTKPAIMKITTLDEQPISSAAFWGSALYLSAEEVTPLKLLKW